MMAHLDTEELDGSKTKRKVSIIIIIIMPQCILGPLQVDSYKKNSYVQLFEIMLLS